MADCLFCKIVAGQIPATKVAENEKCLAFRDIGPKAPTHVLVIPKAHVDSINEVADTSILADMTAMAKEIAASEGIAAKGFRLVVNTGAEGGQTVFHLHMHILGGRQMKWPPG
jgi:histidine triad (HIT) family protein